MIACGGFDCASRIAINAEQAAELGSGAEREHEAYVLLSTACLSRTIGTLKSYRVKRPKGKRRYRREQRSDQRSRIVKTSTMLDLD